MILIMEVLLKNCKMEKYRKSVFVVTFSKTKKGIQYLLLKRKLHWKGWEFPKGGIDKWESEEESVKREVKEETGLNAKEIKRFDFREKYRYKKKFSDRSGILGQSYVLYGVRVKKPFLGRIKIDKHEHTDSKWLSFDKAIKNLRWPNQKRCMKIVDKWLKDKGKETE